MPQTKNRTTDHGIPYSLKACFQEYDFEAILPRDHARLIIERVLSYGNRAELEWLFKVYDQSQVRSWVETVGSRRLSRRRYNMWCVILGLPPTEPHREQEEQIWPH